MNRYSGDELQKKIEQAKKGRMRKRDERAHKAQGLHHVRTYVEADVLRSLEQQKRNVSDAIRMGTVLRIR